jgi:hypothetical protein
VVVAVVAVRVMQVTVDQVIGVIAMGHCFMSASWAMHMVWSVTRAPMLRGAPVGVPVGDFDHMLISVVAVLMVQVAILQVVDVVRVADRRMTTLWPVVVRVDGMFCACGFRH